MQRRKTLLQKKRRVSSKHAAELYVFENPKGAKGIGNAVPKPNSNIHNDAMYRVGVATLAGGIAGAAVGGVGTGPGVLSGAAIGVASECGRCHRPGR